MLNQKIIQSVMVWALLSCAGVQAQSVFYYSFKGSLHLFEVEVNLEESCVAYRQTHTNQLDFRQSWDKDETDFQNVRGSQWLDEKNARVRLRYLSESLLETNQTWKIQSSQAETQAILLLNETFIEQWHQQFPDLYAACKAQPNPQCLQTVNSLIELAHLWSNLSKVNECDTQVATRFELLSEQTFAWVGNQSFGVLKFIFPKI